MKINYLFLALFIALNSCTTVKNEKSDRIKTNINREWQFTFSDESDDFSTEKSESAQWDSIGLPHTFSLPYFRSESFYTGYGWYHKTLHIDENWLNKNISLEFDGVFQVAAEGV
jgi:beta-galactosidase